jgi:5-oxoprolinase (ATP-hydrolysing)
MPMVKIVPRGHTATVDAYLTPLIKAYIDGFASGFDENFSKVDVSFMMSDGGLCPMELFCGYRSILSGPAGSIFDFRSVKFVLLFIYFVLHFVLSFAHNLFMKVVLLAMQ